MIGQIYPDNTWQIERLGCFTASRIDELLTNPRSKSAKEAGELSETAKSYILEKASELTTGTIRQFSNASVEWGELYEPEAADIIQKVYTDMIYFGRNDPKFFRYTKFSGSSPDGTSKDGRTVFEIKCPENPSNHITYCLLKSAEDLKKCQRTYYHQIQFNMLCVAKNKGIYFNEMSGFFVTYCPIVTEGFKKLKLIAIAPDIDFEKKINKSLEVAELELVNIIEEMREQNNIVL